MVEKNLKKNGFVMHEKYMNFKFQGSQIKFHGLQPHPFVYVLSVLLSLYYGS